MHSLRSCRFALIAIGLVACSSSNDADDTDEGALGGAGGGATSFTAALVGEYELVSDDFGGHLKIRGIDPLTLDLTVVRRSGGNAHGDLKRRLAVVDGEQATYRGRGDCEIVLVPTGSEVRVVQSGTCSEEGFGAYVSASGTYRRLPPKPQLPEMGVYKLDPAVSGIGGTLEITSMRPFVFDLTAVADGPSGRHGEILDGVAELHGDVAEFKPSPDCFIELTLRTRHVNLFQKGSCESLGFGAFIDASGKYVQQ